MKLKILFIFLITLNCFSFNISSLKKDIYTAPKVYDWIILSSDEVLKGEIISLHQEEIEFDSDVLGVLMID